MIGKKFNHLLVVAEAESKNGRKMWKCKCDCGNFCVVSGQYLRNGRVKSCGCMRHKNTVKDLVGKKFNMLTVVARADNDKNGGTAWLCKCDCGNEVVVSGKHLKNGNTKSCGCLKHRHKYKDLTNMQFGKLTAKYIVSTNPAKWHCICGCGNEVDVLADSLINGRTKSCGCLRSNLVSATNSDKAFDNRDDYPQWFIDELAHEEDKERARKRLITTNESLDFVCKIHGIYNQIVSNHIKLSTGEPVYGCPCCSNNISHSGSKCELEIKEYIGIDDVVKDRTILDRKEIDLYYPKYNIGIEYNGSVYHASIGGVYKDMPRYYHRDKFLKAKEKGVHLVTIFDVDWETNKERIKMYLDSIFKPSKKIFARKCTINKIDKKTADKFTDKYHIQGKARLNTINYGLFYNDELVSVMSFGSYRLRKHIEGQYELHRYCVKAGITVIGGASKLFKTFEREYAPDSILSFSDNDYFLGNLYNILGFKNAGQSVPRYYWFLDNKELRREQCQLSKLKVKYPKLVEEAYTVKASNKEDYVMTKLGACKVFRCGNTKWVLDKLN